MKIAVFCENCILAGERAWENERDENWDSLDIVTFEGDAREFEAYARMYESNAQNGRPSGIYDAKVAKTLREAMA